MLNVCGNYWKLCILKLCDLKVEIHVIPRSNCTSTCITLIIICTGILLIMTQTSFSKYWLYL